MARESVFFVDPRTELGPSIGGLDVSEQPVTLDQGTAGLFRSILIAAARCVEIAAHRGDRGFEVGERRNRATSTLAKGFSAQHRSPLFEPGHQLAHLFWRSGGS